MILFLYLLLQEFQNSEDEMWGLGLRHLIVEYVNYNQDTPVANTGICIALESMITESKHSE